jgi:hypothetical protein
VSELHVVSVIPVPGLLVEREPEPFKLQGLFQGRVLPDIQIQLPMISIRHILRKVDNLIDLLPERLADVVLVILTALGEGGIAVDQRLLRISYSALISCMSAVDPPLSG